jgi:nitroimidazol reductase NimA-like FMN-containing flavoprotein (pyridoxamine 5'-phosphate oxidase superfamily)
LHAPAISRTLGIMTATPEQAVERAPDAPTDAFERTDATTLKRKPERGSYDRELAYRILDEAFIAHVGIAVDGQPFVIPMVHARDGDRLLLHGSVASRLLRSLDRGTPVCVTVTIVDGLVLADAQRNHSVNFRSVVVLGTARRVREPAALQTALAQVVDHIIPGRAADSRAANDQDQRDTLVVEIALTTASVKIREGGPAAPTGDTVGCWTGVLPIALVAGEPIPDERTGADAPNPPYLSPWRRPGSAA